MKQDIQPQELHSRLLTGESIRIVDVRSSLEFGFGHVPGAVNIPLSTIGAEIPGVSSDEPIVLVCQAGGRSGMACERIKRNHANLFNLVGGTQAWRAAGFEVEARPKSPRSLDRQTHFVAGLLLIVAVTLYRTVDPAWIYLALLPAFGLMLDALTGICPMTLIIKQMPWNKPSTSS